MVKTKMQRDLEPFGPLVDIHQGGVDEDEGDEAESGASDYSARGDGDRAGGGGNENENAGSVGAALGIHVGVKQTRNHECDRHKDQDERARGAGPLRRHAEAGKVAGDEVQQAGHGGGARKGKNENGAGVVQGAENTAEILVGQVSHGPAVGRPAFFEVGRGDEQGGDEAGGHEEDAHDDRGGRQQAPGIADAERRDFRSRSAA